MSFNDLHAQHLNAALDRIRESVDVGSSIAKPATLSLCAEAIARVLADAAQIEVGSTLMLPWHELPKGQQERFRQLAELAIESLDPERDRESAEYAVNEILQRDAGPGQAHGWGVEEIARETLAVFRSHQALPKVSR